MITTACFDKNAAAGVVVLMLGAAVLNAQNPSPAPTPSPAKEFDIMLLKDAGLPGGPLALPLVPGAMGMDFTTVPIDVAGETVIDAPYSAEAVTEVVQPLADGNRIVRQNTATVYRDSAGRTRREQSLDGPGRLVAGTERRINITDPQAGISYVLDMRTRTAHKMPVPKIRLAQPPPLPNTENLTFEVALPPPGPGGAPMQGAVLYRRDIVKTQGAPLVEQLGTQVIEGVVAEGTRSTITIPAGAIGNEQPINVVSERWTSSELKVLVQSRQSDPRFGETTYRLTNIVRAEPPSSLFDVPSDFAIVGPAGQK
jgi:hypothetical protein